MKKIKEFLNIKTLMGRYRLSILLMSMGIFSQYSTIEFLSTNYVIFEYLCYSGVIIFTINTLYWFGEAIYLNSKE